MKQSWPEEWDFPIVDWTPFDLTVEEPPDFDHPFAVDEEDTIPTEWSLATAYPNPFNPSTTIAFTVPYQQDLNVSIYNLLGQHVRTLVNEPLQAGAHRIVWDANDSANQPVASGMYFMRLNGVNHAQVQKLILMR